MHVGLSAMSLSRDTVAKKREYNEEDREGHALVDSTLRFDAIIHHHIPVLAGQDLANIHKYSDDAMTSTLTSTYLLKML